MLLYVQCRRLVNWCALVVVLVVVAGCGSAEESAETHYQRGLELLAAENYAKAGVEFRNALQRNERLSGAWYGLSQVEAEADKIEGVVRALNKVVELDPEHVEARFQLAKIYLLAGELDQSLTLVNAAYDLDKERPDILALRAALLLRLNDQPGAIAEAEKALAINPGHGDALAVLAAERLQREDPTGALLFVNRGLNDAPDDLGLLLLKVRIFETIDDPDQVEATVRRIVEAHPEELGFRRALVQFYVKHDRPDDAEQELRAIAAARPADTEAKLDIVRFLGSTKGADAARQELVTLIAAAEEKFEYQLALSQLLIGQGQRDEAIELLEEVIATESSDTNVINAKLAMARIRLNGEQVAEAAAIVSDVLSSDDGNPDALALRATMRIEDGKLDDAIADLREALNAQPRSVPLLQLMARALERQGSVELAEGRLAEATKISEFDPAVALSYVDLLVRRGAHERAEGVLSDTVSRHPNSAAALKRLAQIRLTRQDWTGAQEAAEALEKLGDEPGVADQIRGAALIGQRKFDESIQALHSAHSASPTAVQPMAMLVSAYLRNGQPDEAEAFVRSMLQASPDNADAWVLLGALQAADSLDEAKTSFETATRNQPDNFRGYAALANLHLRKDQPDEAIAALRKGLEQVPADFTLRMTLANIYEQTEDYEAAIELYEQLYRDFPDAPVIANNLASLLADHRQGGEDLDRAQVMASKLRHLPVPHFKDTLGWISYRQGDYRPAVNLLEEAVAELPDMPLVRYHLGTAYAALQQKEKALEHLQQALELPGASDDLKGKAKAALDEIASKQD